MTAVTREDAMPDKAAEKSSSETNEPWKKLGQTSRDSSIKRPKNGVEQEKHKKQDK